MHELILTSQSPRRRQILKDAGYEFSTFPIEVSEILNENLNIEDRIKDCAKQKVMAAKKDPKLLKVQGNLLLGADTMVIYKGQTLGKPTDEQHAFSILNQLSGQVHSVITGFCLYDLSSESLILGHESTEVHFHKLAENEIWNYIQTKEPMDKAGAYGIQGLGKKFVRKFEGSWLNVVGLPLENIERVIRDNGWTLKKTTQ